jgi:Na+-driven multidrug efflux pump
MNALLARIRDGKPMTVSQQVKLTIQLSTPAMIAQLSSIIMQYIDAAMVGQLGAEGASEDCAVP